MSKKIEPKDIVQVMPYRTQVALFDSYKNMKRYFLNRLNIDLEGGSASLGCAAYELDNDGVAWFGLSIEKDANLATLVHECSHVVDFVFEVHGVPCTFGNTEVRAYTLAELVGDTCEVFGFDLQRAE